MHAVVVLGRLMVDRQRLVLYRPAIDDRHDLRQILVGIVYVADLDLLVVNEQAKVLADRPGGGGPVAGPHRQQRISAKIAQHPERINAGPLGC